MDVFGLFKLRLEFVQQLHEKSCEPFEKIKQQIENEEAPFEPPYSEDGEPPFLAEWLEADESLQVLGYSSLSMLAASFQLFFKTWETEFRTPDMPRFKGQFKKKGWLRGYQQYFNEILGINFEESPVEMIRLEEIIRARNIIQHPDDISSNTVRFTDDDLEVLQEPYLSSEIDRRMSASQADLGRWFLPISLHVSPEKFKVAQADVLSFTDWLDEQVHRVMEWNRPKR